VRGRTVATDDGEPPPLPNRDWAARPPRLPPPAQLRPRGTVRGRDRPIGFHHPRSHRDCSNLALEVCSISLLTIGNWPQVAPLTDQSPCIVGIGLWHALCGVTSALFIFIVCLLACLICLPALITIACDWTVDRPVPSFVLNHRGCGVAVVGATRLPIGCPSTKGLLPRRDGDRTRFIAWLRSVSVHW